MEEKYCFWCDHLLLEIKIQTRSYETDDGRRRYVTKIVTDNVSFLDSKKNSYREYICVNCGWILITKGKTKEECNA